MESLERINQQTKISYNKAAQKYYDLFHNELDRKQFDIEFIDSYLHLLKTGSFICSAGCGPCGHIENYISQKGFKIYGIDISERCIEIARKNSPGIKFDTGDFSKLNISNDYFDGVMSYYSIIDTPKIYINRILREFYRVLKKNGLILIAVKEGNGEGFRKELLGIKTKIYFSLFTEDELKKYIEDNGFEIIKMLTRNPYEDEIKNKRIFLIGRKI